MCYVHNQWYDISCATLYIYNILCVFSWNKTKRLTARTHSVESLKKIATACFTNSFPNLNSLQSNPLLQR